jgi:hypothetical protein
MKAPLRCLNSQGLGPTFEEASHGTAYYLSDLQSAIYQEEPEADVLL